MIIMRNFEINLTFFWSEIESEKFRMQFMRDIMKKSHFFILILRGRNCLFMKNMFVSIIYFNPKY